MRNANQEIIKETQMQSTKSNAERPNQNSLVGGNGELKRGVSRGSPSTPILQKAPN